MKTISNLAAVLLCGAVLFGCSKSDNTATNSSAASSIPNNQTTNSIPASDPRITVMGRSQSLEDGSLRFAYPGVTLKFTAKGEAAQLIVSSSSDQSYLEIIVDEGEPRAVKLSASWQVIDLFSDASEATREIQVIHRSETWHGIVTVKGLAITRGDLGPAPALPERRLLVLGDSVTCGEAVERTAECTKDSSWWNPRLSYGMLTAKALNAQVQLVCYGGRGLVRSWNGKTDEQNLPEYFELAIANPQQPSAWDHQEYTPDLVLSAIGTNDFSEGIPERHAYVNAYATLVERLLNLYPNAQVILTEGAILNGEKKEALTAYLTETAARVNSPRVYILPSKHYPGDECDAHPTKEQHAAMAQDWAPLLQQVTGWPLDN